jgi:ATP-dependent Clp protease ATP-binding subunit ClpX
MVDLSSEHNPESFAEEQADVLTPEEDIRELMAQVPLMAPVAIAYELEKPMDYGFSEYGYRVQVSTRDLPFIACGAFSGMDELLRENRSSIGFRNVDDDDLSQLTLDEVGSFQKFGFLPELIDRFSRIISFPRLPAETLKQILLENVLPQFKNEFKGEGLDLVTESALDHIVARSEKRDTGARGLQA